MSRNTQFKKESNHTAILLDPEIDLNLSGNGVSKPKLSGTIHPFHKSYVTFTGKFHKELHDLFSTRKSRRILICLFLNFIAVTILLSWFSATNSVALLSYTVLSFYDMLSLLACLVSCWSTMKQDKIKSFSISNNLSQIFSYERVEILAVFSSVVITQLAAIFITKEAFERLIEKQDIHIGRLIPGVIVVFFMHIISSCFVKNKAFCSVREASYSSWMQEHAADLSRTICGVMPILQGVLLPRMDPLLLAHFCAAGVIILLDVFLQVDSYLLLDTIASFVIILMVFGTLWPITVCSANVLLQTTSPFILSQLDKLLSETQTLDGVLELQNESFYTLSLNGSKSLSKPGHVLSGSLQVRVRRDADEQMVLAHVTSKLSPLVPYLTVQVVKDDWAPAASSATSDIVSSNLSTLKTSGSYYVTGFNKPAAAVAPIVQSSSRDKLSNECDDFSFKATAKGASSINLVKPLASATDIEKMYKAAGFKSKPMNKYSAVSMRTGSQNFKQGGMTGFKRLPTNPVFPNQSKSFPIFPTNKKTEKP